MWEWLIIVPAVGLAAFIVARRLWRVGRSDQGGCGCSGCAGGPDCPGSRGDDSGGPCRGCSN